MQPDLFDSGYSRVAAFPIMNSREFYKSEEWLQLRYKTLREAVGRCVLCGACPSDGNPLQVDHIKPRSRFPRLALDPDNLQVLCRNCNIGKGNFDTIDWRDGD